jgi:CubicO group peptidase (beta-lactamase class C family)
MIPPQADAYAARVLETGITPAAALAFTDRDGPPAVRVYGDAGPDRLWQIGSIGKSFTAVLALQLAEQGLLDLHAPVTDHLPWFAVRSAFPPITPHHLLTHTAGLIQGAEIATASNYDVVALADTDAAYPPGAHFWYSNVGYRAVGLVLEAVTGQAYPDLLQRRILDPLGMRDSTPTITNDLRRRMGEGYAAAFDDRPWRPEHGLAPAPWIESAEADGSLCCTISDLAAWLRALWAEDGRLLSPAGFALLKSPLVSDDQDAEGGRYGYGLMVAEHGFGHSGGMLGFHSYLWADTRSGLGAVAAVNGIGGARLLCLGSLALARGEQPEDPAPQIAEPMADDGSCPEPWRPYLGHYRSFNPWLTNFRVAGRRGGLAFGFDCAGSERHPLTQVGEAEFRVGEQEWAPERLRFDTVMDGRAQRAILSGAHYHRTFTA